MKGLPALGFVPENDLIPFFEDLVVAFPQEQEVKVVAYFKSTYIRGMQIDICRSDPRFPINL